MQNDILKDAGPRDLTNMEKTRAVRVMRERHGYRLARLFAAVGLARATYHRLARRLGEPSRVDLATPLVHEAFERLGRVAGYRRVHRVVNTRMRVGERLVRMIMRRDGLVPLYMGKAPRAYSSYKGGCPYVICQVRLMRGCVVSCRGLGACAGVVSVRGGVVVVVWVPPGW